MSRLGRALLEARFLAEYSGFRGAAAMFRALPVDQASSLGAAVWGRAAPFNRRHARALAHLAAALPELSTAEHARIAAGMWDNLGRVMAESFHLDALAADPARYRFAPDPGVLDALEPGRGAVVASLHFGNWELAVLASLRHGMRPAAVYHEIRNPRVDAYVRRLRDPFYPGGLHGKGAATARRILSWVRDGGTLSLLADQRDNRGVVVPFFGMPAPSTPFPALVARSLDVPLIIGACRRLDGAWFEARASLVQVPRTADRGADIAEATARIHRAFEAWIRERPEQWMWGHRRWNPRLAIDPRLTSAEVGSDVRGR